MWENDLAALTPVPEDLLIRDAKLRGELGAPDVRYLLVLEAKDADGVLALSETLEPALDALVAKNALDASSCRAATCRASKRSARVRRSCPIARRFRRR
jgi:predicted exporter